MGIKEKVERHCYKIQTTSCPEILAKETEDLKANPRGFYKTFRPLRQTTRSIHVRTDGNIEKNQEKVGNILVDYFSTMPGQIRGEEVSNLSEQDLYNHSNLTNIIKGNDVKNYPPMTLLKVVKKVFESMMSSQVANYIDSAHRKKHSWKTTLSAVTDMSKAFDSLYLSLTSSKHTVFLKSHLV